MKVFYLIRKIGERWGKFEIGVFDFHIYWKMKDAIDSFSHVRLIGYSKFGAYLLDEKSIK